MLSSRVRSAAQPVPAVSLTTGHVPCPPSDVNRPRRASRVPWRPARRPSQQTPTVRGRTARAGTVRAPSLLRAGRRLAASVPPASVRAEVLCRGTRTPSAAMAGVSWLFSALLVVTVVSLVTGSPCPPDWRQSGAWCYLTNSSSSLSWAGADALCREHGGALTTIKSRSKLLDIIDLLKGLTTQRSWWLGIKKSSGTDTSNGLIVGDFDNFGEEKVEKDASETDLCVYMYSDDGLWYWSQCDDPLPYICEKEAERVDVDVVTPDRTRPGAAWFAEHAERIEAELAAAQLNATQSDEKGVYSAEKATMTPQPPTTVTTPMPAPAPSSTPDVSPPAGVLPTLPTLTTAPTPSPCGESWASAAGMCHHVFVEPKNWTSAQAYCVQRGGHLSTFPSQAAQAAVRSLYSFQTGSVWLGLKRDSSRTAFHWLDGSQPEYSAWAQGFPGAGDNHNCVALRLDVGQWITDDCSAVRPFVCTRAVGAADLPTVPTAPPTPPSVCGGGGWWQDGNSCLLFPDEPPVSWHQAQQNCLNLSATLVKITDFQRLNRLGNQKVWIGLNKLAPPHTYRWTDGTILANPNWGVSAATGGDAAGASCVRMDAASTHWSAVNCNAPSRYVCERPADGSRPRLAPPAPAPVRTSCPADWLPYGAERCLRVFPQQAPWQEARSTCRGQAPQDADLVSVASPVQQAFLTTAVKTSPKSLWVGLMYDTLEQHKFLTWTDESPFNFTAWAPGQPSTVCATCPTTCGLVDGGLSSTPAAWSDVACSNRYGFVCQRPAAPDNSMSAGVQAFCEAPHQDYVAVADACYKINQNAKTWSEAADTCQSEGTSLAYVGDVYDNAELVKLLYREGGDQYWLGLSDTGSHGIMKWASPWPSAPTYHNWDPAHRPAAVLSHCAALLPATGLWRQQACATERRPFVCMHAPEKEAAERRDASCPGQGVRFAGQSRCYRLYENAGQGLTWDEAKAACEEKGEQLAVISSIEDFRGVREAVRLLNTPFTAWIGLKSQDSGEFRWVDGSPVTYAAWYRAGRQVMGREPAATSGCVLSSRLADGHWQAVDCSTRRPFVCMTGMDGGGGTTSPLSGGGGASGWTVFGVLLLVLLLVLVTAGVGLWVARRRRVSWLPRWLLTAGMAHHSVENLAYSHRDNALSPGGEGATLENGGLDAVVNRWGSQDQLVMSEDT